jgi:hypothetical protein
MGGWNAVSVWYHKILDTDYTDTLRLGFSVFEVSQSLIALQLYQFNAEQNYVMNFKFVYYLFDEE